MRRVLFHLLAGVLLCVSAGICSKVIKYELSGIVRDFVTREGLPDVEVRLRL